LPWWIWSRPKRGHSDTEYEDAVAGRPDLGRFAIADGASESAFAGDWARCLVASFVAPPEPDPMSLAWFDTARECLLSTLQHRQLPWYLEEQIQQGAFATFLGLDLRPRDDRTWEWHACAVGDCCLFHLRDHDLLQAFPLEHSSEFHQRPELVDSSQFQLPPLQRCHGQAHVGDVFLLATDALAQWLLHRQERRQPLWSQWIDAASSGALPHIPESSDGLRNDDLTVVCVSIRPEGLP
jgi:hypothetical protein